MLNTPRRFAALILLLTCICCFAQAEDIVDITIARGERWSIPEDRLGAFEISDDSILAVEDGRLADIAPTMLTLMGIPQPAEMTGKSLISF